MIEALFERFAALFGFDLLVFSILSNHFHAVRRSRPDVVATWSDTEVAGRWMRICPKRKHRDGAPKDPTESELNAIRHDPELLAEIRLRLSDISWWMRLVCQRIGMSANRHIGNVGQGLRTLVPSCSGKTANDGCESRQRGSAVLQPPQ